MQDIRVPVGGVPMSPVSVETSRLGVRIEIDALCTYKDGDYVEVDISWTDAVALRDSLDRLIDMKENDMQGNRDEPETD